MPSPPLGISTPTPASATASHTRNCSLSFAPCGPPFLRLYEQTGDTDLGGVRRFNEAIDEALTESMTRYTAMTDLYRDQFVGILGHDLRNPLNSIAAGATLLTMTTETDPRSANVASRILRSAHRMGRLIDDLLDLTVMRLGGAIPVKRASFDLEQLCHEVILEAQAAHAGTWVKFHSSGNLAGEWDRDRLAQLLSNLLGNAIRYGDGTTVTLAAHGAPGDVVITVHNRGVPIPPALQDAIFEPLVRHTAAGPGETSGIGLGLFIARAIVASHEGDISVASSESAGTTMSVRLPRVAALRPAWSPLPSPAFPSRRGYPACPLVAVSGIRGISASPPRYVRVSASVEATSVGAGIPQRPACSRRPAPAGPSVPPGSARQAARRGAA